MRPAGRNDHQGRPVADLMIPYRGVRAYNSGMGIRFYCPNGHKLNVKAFLAGRRGICPHCGAKVQIPTQSTLEPGTKGYPSENGAAADSNYAPATELSADAQWVPPGEIEWESSYSETESPIQEPVVSIDMQDEVGGGEDDSVSEPSVPPKLPQAKRLPDDPLAEAPDAVWYVRLSDGTQFGPATAGVMRQWMEEDRIGGDCLVWREGWRDWREAVDAFPNLRDRSMPNVDTGGRIPRRAPPDGLSGAGENARSDRSRSTTSRAVVITILLVAVIVGSVVLAWVVLR